MQHMHGNNPYIFVCSVDPVVHLLLLPTEVHGLVLDSFLKMGHSRRLFLNFRLYNTVDGR